MLKIKKIFTLGVMAITLLNLSSIQMGPAKAVTETAINSLPIIEYLIVTSPVTPGDLVTITTVAYDPDGDNLTYSISDPRFVETATPGVFEWQTQLGDTDARNILITVSDGVNFVDETTFVIVDDSSRLYFPPIFFPLAASFDIVAGDFISFETMVLSVEVIDYSATILPPGAEYINLGNGIALFRWTPQIADIGPHPITFNVFDGVNTATMDTVINVLPPLNNPPVINNISFVSPITEGDLSTITVDATDPDGDNLTYSINDINFTEAGGVFTWQTGAGDAGTYNLIVTVDDGLAQATQNIQLVISPLAGGNNPPVLDPIANQTVDENTLLELVINGSDPDGDPIAFSVTGLPPGAVFDLITNTFTWTPNPGQAGIYDVTFAVSDGALSDSQIVTITVNSLNNPPVINNISFVSPITEGDLSTITVDATDPDGDNLTYTINDINFTEAGGVFTWQTGPGDAGTYNLTVTVDDGLAQATQNIQLVVSPPVVANNPPVLDPIPNQTVDENTLLEFTITGSDPDNDALSFSITGLPPGAVFDLITNTLSWTPTYGQAGTYDVTFSVSDGSLSDSQIVTITVNSLNNPPVINNISFVSPVIEGDQVDIFVGATDPDGDNLTYEINNPNFVEFLPGFFFWQTGPGDAGTYDLIVSVSDGINTTTQNIQLVVSAPAVNNSPVLDFITAKFVDENILLDFIVAGSDPDNDPLVFSATGLPIGATFDPATQRFRWTPTYDQAGLHDITFSISDGSLSDSQTVTITVNNVNRPPALDHILDITANEGDLVVITPTAADPDGDLLSYTFTPPMDANGEWQTGFNDAGIYHIIVSVSDGDLSDSQIMNINVNNVNRVPILDQILDQTVAENSLLEFAMTGTDPDGDPVTFGVAGLPIGATFDPITQTISWTPTYDQAGIYQVTCIISDETLSASSIVTITVTNVNRAPVLDNIPDVIANEGDLIALIPTATDPDGDLLSYTFTPPIDVNGEWQTGFYDAGIYTATVTVSDGDLTDSQIVTITVINVNQAPILDQILNPIVDENTLLEFTITGTDPDGDVIDFSATGLPTGAIFDPLTQVFSWTPTYDQAGVYDVTFSISDGNLTGSQIVTITVDNVNRVPVLDSILDQVVNENSLLEFAMTGTDPDGDIVTFSATGLPIGATFDPTTQTVSWTPNYDQAGIYQITCIISDGILTASSVVNITVNNVNRAPVLDQTLDQVVDENTLLEFTMAGTDPDGDPVIFSAAGLPTGATFDPLTQVFSWIPTYDQAGAYQVTCIINDGTLGASSTILVTVNNVNRAPVLDQILDITVNEGELIILTPTAADPDGDLLSYTFTPPLDANGEWQTSFTDAGTSTTTVTVSDGDLTDFQVVSITVNDVIQAPPSGGGGGGGGSYVRDVAPPSNPSLIINEGDEGTDNDIVNLLLSAVDADFMIISNNQNFNGKAWEIYNENKVWVLAAGLGDKNVYAKFKDKAGNETEAVFDNIILTAKENTSLDSGEIEAEEESFQRVLGVKLYPDDSLIRGEDKKIYLVKDGKKYYISTLEELQEYVGREIYNVTQEVLIQYPDYEEVIEFLDGTLIRGSDNKIYVIVGGKKSHIINLEELLKYIGQEIHDVPDDVLIQY